MQVRYSSSTVCRVTAIDFPRAKFVSAVLAVACTKSEPPESVFDERVAAVIREGEDPVRLLGTADDLKNRGEYDDAAVYYLAALRVRPSFTEASYQLACNFALWDREGTMTLWIASSNPNRSTR